VAPNGHKIPVDLDRSFDPSINTDLKGVGDKTTCVLQFQDSIRAAEKEVRQGALAKSACKMRTQSASLFRSNT
jgi:hypothetical protein